MKKRFLLAVALSLASAGAMAKEYACVQKEGEAKQSLTISSNSVKVGGGKTYKFLTTDSSGVHVYEHAGEFVGIQDTATLERLSAQSSAYVIDTIKKTKPVRLITGNGAGMEIWLCALVAN